MSMNLMAKAMSIRVGNPLRKLVLIKLADNANDKGECWPSYQHIADQCEIGRSTVKNHIRALEDMGMLRREFRKNGELNQSNLFYLTLDNPVRNRIEHSAPTDDPGQDMPEGVGQEVTGVI
ncbi:helix-turn-helix domain-containing protein, partial [Klebsiella oxytoca]|uniref:helix-turn-helix domain-containing protein n=1 Tax=Klebsiella oxytoca TaxID=571 RepID=UPI00292D661D